MGGPNRSSSTCFIPAYLSKQVEVALVISKRREAGSQGIPPKGTGAETEVSKASVGTGSESAGTVVRFIGAGRRAIIRRCHSISR